MSSDDESTLSNTIIDKLAPTTADGTPIVWSDDNDAHIEGLLFEVGKNYKRKGQFQTFFKHHAAILSNGKLAVDSADSVHFITARASTIGRVLCECPGSPGVFFSGQRVFFLTG